LKVRVGDITASLPDRLEDFSHFDEKHFIVYVQDQFLDPASYKSLVRDLADFFSGSSFKPTRENKLWFRVKSHQKLPKEMPRNVRSLCGLFWSRPFHEWFRNTHEGFFERGLIRPIFPRSRFSMRLALGLNTLFLRIFGTKLWNVYSSSVEFSCLPMGGAIPPHTDSSQKRLALVFFTPFNQVSDAMRTVWGTEFWRSRAGQATERSWQTNTKVGQEMEEFKKRHEIFLKVPYDANTICGFVKSDNSWHSVAPNPLPEDRIALVVNVWDRAAPE